VAVWGNYAYVADFDAGLQVVDISNPASPAIVGSVDTPDYALDVAVAGTYAYVADYASGLQVVDISNPASPAIIGSGDTPGESLASPIGVAVGGDYAFIAGYGLQILPAQCPASTAVEISSFEAASISGEILLRQSHPNPFRGESERTAIGFELAGRTRATLRVFDASGRLVRIVLHETLEAGVHSAFWDGRNARGDAVATGVYFYRLDAGKFSETRPLVRLR